ncbi:MAG: hypothetical protein K1X28_03315 [Parachlamydiales bacterium]|nr:hypothetical protein [Parachlamydiales bacterium]
MAFSSAVVPFQQVDMSPVLQRMGFSPEDRQALVAGMKYLSGEESQKWLEERRGDLDKIGRAAEEAIRIQERCEVVSAGISSATQQIRAGEQSRKEIDERESQIDSQHTQERDQLFGERQAIQQQIRDEGRIALFSFTNPLTKKIWRTVATIGQHALNVTVPVLGVVHREALVAKCGQVASMALAAAKECATTVAQPAIYVPLAIATGVTLACSYAFKVGQRILRNEARADVLQRRIDDCDSVHRRAKEQVAKEKEGVADLIQQNTTRIEMGQKEREELARRGGAIDSMFASVREKIAVDIAQRQLGLLKKAIAQPEQNEFVVQAGRTSMQTVMDAMLVAYSDVQQKPLLMGPAARPAIEEI